VEIRSRSTQFHEVQLYAVIKTGGKQYRVAAGEKIKVEQIAADVGQEVVIDQVLAVGNGAEIKVGTPLVSGASVKATVVAHGKHDKVHIFKMRRRKHYQKRQGHRQQFTELQIVARLPCWFGSHATTPGAPSRRRTLWVGEMVSITSSVWTVPTKIVTQMH
jgi:large subunit ribosomal protein L21